MGVNIQSYSESTGGSVANRLPGIYVLLFSLTQDETVTVGKLGTLKFPVGGYAYVGSGMKGAEARVRRHLRTHPRASWHLDYLLPIGEPVAAILGHTADRLECPLAQVLGHQFQVIPRFGSSDCRCSGHLFQSADSESLAKATLDALERFGCAIKVLPLSPEGELFTRQ